MLVEDDHSISEMVDHYLTKEGFGIVHAFDGEEGIRLFQQGSYDLVLLDIMLPKLNGMDFSENHPGKKQYTGLNDFGKRWRCGQGIGTGLWGG
ncbi:two-component response regulator YcbM [Bacillus subtilis]|nr:two-component response regulator YcbM [Bacillus subtilis]